MKHTEAQRARRAALAQRNASPRQRRELARRKAMGVGLIERPLRFIAEQMDTYETDKSGAMVRVESYVTADARIAAQCGDGSEVRRSAFHCL